MNAQEIYLLSHEDYFGVSEDIIGRTGATIMLYSYVAGMVYSVLAGWFYDRFNRKMPMLIAALSSAVFIALQPLTAPNQALLVIFRVLIGFGQIQINAAPLVADYIKHQSRGVATSIS